MKMKNHVIKVKRQVPGKKGIITLEFPLNKEQTDAITALKNVISEHLENILEGTADLERYNNKSRMYFEKMFGKGSFYKAFGKTEASPSEILIFCKEFTELLNTWNQEVKEWRKQIKI